MTVILDPKLADKWADRGVTNWRSAHSWLKGYSDAQRGVVSPSGTYDEAAYLRGAETARAQ